ncbi:MAG: transglycosylase SLT domain-containing protein [Actinophytocola sp.]|uniref:C40 family peptidase n=1 Tax=Actinophytocola sp. TaxID=1872138 RepID=UPI001320DF3A|nr:C40 family peptidase [Actinophytocola sp.]MPZ79660.1 transglycosylase SLT domain-containing protein [Actinophytocola sp.]
MSKIAATGAAFATVIILLVGGGATAVVQAIFGGNNSQPSAAAPADIPADYLAFYSEAAGVCPGLDWSILAAIGKIESNHGRSTLVGVADGTENAYGAGGPMQFLKPTFDGVIARHTIPAGGASPPSRYNPHDAIHAAAYNLCDNGARRGDLRAAIFAYNHADWYVNEVLAQAKQYADTATVGTGDCNAIQATNTAAMTAINYACGQRGLPYVWGGNGPESGHAGFDCSGLTKAAYGAAGITLPRTAHTQYHAGPHVPDGQPLLPGDLVFYGNPNTKIQHVGLYIGGGLMVDAPDFGQTVGRRPYRYSGDAYAGATRPAGSVAA